MDRWLTEAELDAILREKEIAKHGNTSTVLEWVYLGREQTDGEVPLL